MNITNEISNILIMIKSLKKLYFFVIGDTLQNNNSGIWDTFIGVTDLKNADVVVFLEGIPHNIEYNMLKNKILFCIPREPLCRKNWENLNLKHGYTYDNLFCVVATLLFIGKNYDFLKDLQYTPHEKTFS